MWTWLDLYSNLVVFLIYSLSSIEPKMAGYNPSAVHYSRRMCVCPPTFIDPSFLSPFGNNLHTGSLWSSLCKILGIVHSPTTSSQPQSNRIVERFHRQLKVSFHARLLGLIGFTTFPWFYWVSRAFPEKIGQFPSSINVLGSCWFFLAGS